MRLIAYIFAGFLSALGVAWALAAWSPREISRTPAPHLARHPVVSTWPTDGASWYTSDTYGLSVGFAMYEFDEPARGIAWDCGVYSAGFPMRCVGGFFQAALPNPQSPLNPIRRTPSILEHGIPVPRSVSAAPLSDLFPARYLPIRPIWFGLAVNSAVMAALLFVAVRFPSAARRALRRRQGRCGHCGHPLAGAARCPECGVGHCAPTPCDAG